MRKILYPKKIVASKLVKNEENLKKEKSMQIGLNEPFVTTIEKGGYVILDFGKEICGSLRLLAHSSQGSQKLKITYGESVSEAMSEISEKGATNDHAVRDYVYFIPPFSDTCFTNSGFRFVMLKSVDSEITIKNAVVIPTVYDKPFKGKFECDDKLVNKIFDTAAYTLRLCLQNGMIWDGIKRDRLVWIGDINPEMLTINCVFGSLPHVENSLSFAKEQSPLPLWMNNFPTYSLWWIINLRDYYFQNKNQEYILEQKDYVNGLIAQLSGVINQNGETEYPFNFIDWPTYYCEGDPDEDKRFDEIAGTHALTVYAVKCAKEILEILGEDCSLCEDILSRLSKIEYKVKKYKQISGVKIASGLGTQHDADIIVRDGAKGMSTFMSYFILKGASKFGYTKQAIDMMKEYYGAMLDLGATTFWEDFNIEWAKNAGRIDKKPVKGKKDVHGDFGDFCYIGFRHSFCHGWSSGVVPFLMQEVGGIEIVKAGCEEIRITPRLGDLNFVKISYPTPYGILKVEHRKNSDGTITTKTEIPNGVKIVK